MSSAEEQPEGAAQLFDREKKRKIPRACDLCRRRKIRCDGGEIPGHRCSNCVAYESECTYLQPAAKKRNPPKGYVESLQRRVSNMEKILQTLFPDTDLKDLDGEVDVDRWLLSRMIGNLPSNTSNSSDSAFSTTAPGLSPLLLSSTIASEVVQTEEEYAHEPLAGDLKQPSLQLRDRFFGKSSSFLLVKKAINMKQEYGDGIQHVTPVNSHRDVFWKSSPWEDATSVDRHHYDFPPDDLMQSLVHLYFTQVNISSPVLHRPIFERSIAEKLHLRNELFAATLLAVVAIGSRYSDDPRVFLDNTNSPNSCGWKWFSQVPRNRMRRSALEPPSLYELQLLTLLTIYGVGSSAPQECWTWIGVGIRLAQEVGAHRRKPLGYKMTVEDELWKRAFWILVCMDKFISAFLGRPCAMHDEDFDLDLPAECDDEYWEHPDPDMAFKQPANKPSTMAYFVSYLKLYKILGTVLRTIYAINKSPVPLGFVGKKWEQQTVAELDSALNSWVDSIPDHLRWDPHCQNPVFFIQSVSLYTSYYHIQILIHRPFIPSSQHPSPLTFPSLAICANAARSSCHVADVLLQRGIMALPHMQISTFTAGIILLLNIWSGKKSGISINANREMEDVHKCMNVLRACESRFHPAGRFWDVLCGLATMGNLPLPVYPERTSKRGRDFNEAELESSVAYPSGNYNGAIASTAEDPKWLSHVAPSAAVIPALEKLAVAQNQPTTYPLPMYSNELGRLPLHGEFNFADETQFGYTYDNSCTLNEPTYAVQSNIPALPVANPYPIEHAPSYMMDQQLYDQMAKIFASNFVDPTGLDIEHHQNTQVHERTSNPYPPSFPSGSQPDHRIYPAGYHLLP